MYFQYAVLTNHSHPERPRIIIRGRSYYWLNTNSLVFSNAHRMFS